MIDLVTMDFIFQKEHIVAYRLPEKLRHFLTEARKTWDQLRHDMERAGVTIADDESPRWAYGFLCFESETEYRYASPSYAMVREGLAGLKALESFALWHQRTWPRHWTNTILRENGFSEIEVRAYHWHCDSSLHPFRRHRLEPLLPETVLDRMTICLWEALGL